METSPLCRIALVGPDTGIAAAAMTVLRAAGHICEPFVDPGSALREIDRGGFDLLLVAGLGPRRTIATLLADIPGRRFSLPVIALGDISAPAATAAALEEGVDHVLAWPVAPQVLLAQVKAAVRRAGPAASGIDAAVGHVVFHREGMRIRVDGVPALVTAKEYALALLLCRNLGKPLTREQIFSAVWDDDSAPTTRTLDVHVSRLRTKLLLRPDRGFRLSALYGRGYRLDYEAVAARTTQPPALPPVLLPPRRRSDAPYPAHAR